MGQDPSYGCYETLKSDSLPLRFAALRESYGFRLADLTRIESALAAAIAALCAEWGEIHGDH
jgi:hypothetical protein